MSYLVGGKAMSKNNFIHFYYQNLSGMRTKLFQINHRLASSGHDVICLTETWCKDNVDMSLLTRNLEYDCYFQHRSHSSNATTDGGGTAIIIKKSYRAVQLFPNIDNPFTEFTAVSFLIDGKKYFVMSAYLVSYNRSLVVEEFCHILQNFLRTKYDFITICGDFNLTNIKWIFDDSQTSDDNSLLPVVSVDNQIDNDFIDHMNKLALLQLNHVPNERGRFLDLIFTNNLNNIFDISHETKIWLDKKTHHHIPLSFFHKTPIMQAANYNQLNFAFLNMKSSKNYLISNPFISANPLEFYDYLKNVINTAGISKKKDKFDAHPWLRNSSQYANLQREKDKLHKSLKSNPTTENKSLYHQICNTHNELFKLLKEAYYVKLIENPTNGNDTIYTLIKHIKKDKSCFPLDTLLDGVPVDPGDRNAKLIEVLSSNFVKSEFPTVFRNTNGEPDLEKIHTTFYNNRFADCFTNFDIRQSVDDIFAIVSSFSSRKDIGPQLIPLNFILYNWPLIGVDLTSLINSILTSGNLPINFKEAYLTPVPKRGNSIDLRNYRGVAMQSIIPKIIDKIIASSIYKCIGSKLSKNQHGFIPTRSTISNLLHITQKIQTSLAKGNRMDVIYFDFSKAFDVLDHYILLKKIANFSFPFSFFKLIASFIFGRKFILKIDQTDTNLSFTTESGAPQGSHSAPPLYLIYADDLSEFISTAGILQYADDTKLFLEIKSDDDKDALQADIQNLVRWAETNKLKLNADKTVFVSYANREPEFPLSYYVTDKQINTSETVRDLGIIFDKRLKFSTHINSMLMRTNSMIYFASGLGKEVASRRLYIPIFKSYVLPICEYGVSVWSQNQTSATMNYALEKPLRSMSRLAIGSPMLPLNDGYLDYKERLQRLNLTSLARRRDLIIILTFTKILRRHIDSFFIFNQITEYINVHNFDTRRRNIFTNFSNLPVNCFLRKAFILVNNLPTDINYFEISYNDLRNLYLYTD